VIFVCNRLSSVTSSLGVVVVVVVVGENSITINFLTINVRVCFMRVRAVCWLGRAEDDDEGARASPFRFIGTRIRKKNPSSLIILQLLPILSN